MSNFLTWVIKSSKKCNLRCKYCYEFNSLNDPAKISIEDLRTVFIKALEISNHFKAEAKFCWHGGEPLLMSPTYYLDAFELQREIFHTCSYRPNNLIQTNLTIINENTIKLLKKFDYVSVSLDVAGGLRVSTHDRDIQSLVMNNLAILKNNDIAFGAISVLNAKNHKHIETIFNFFNNARISFRILPFYRSATQDQINEYALSDNQVLTAYEKLLDLWFTQNKGILIKPIDDIIKAAITSSFSCHPPTFKYNKAEREFVFIVDTNLDIYSVADTYNSKYRLGNILTDSTQEILNSDGRILAISEANERVTNACHKCYYYGACSGWPMAEATPIERHYDRSGALECSVIKPLISRSIKLIEASTTAELNS